MSATVFFAGSLREFTHKVANLICKLFSVTQKGWFSMNRCAVNLRVCGRYRSVGLPDKS